MKRSICILLAAYFLFLFSSCFAEDYSGKTIEELQVLRDEKLQELTEINAAIGSMIKAQELSETSEEKLGKIKDLFPDEVVAVWVRDQLRKFSIEQAVTQAELDKIKSFRIFSSYGIPEDLTGIGYLRNLESILIDHNNSSGFTGTRFPDDFYTLTKLKKIYAWECAGWDKSNIDHIDPRIGNMVSLEYIGLGHAKITTIPDTICNLTHLETLSLPDTLLTELPENIGNLTKLTYLDISNTQIESLPDSIWNLNLETVKMAGTPIR